jgi:hypothetical protein
LKLPTIPHDKAMHACYGAALSLVGALLAYATQRPLWAGALILAVVFAVATEIRDRITKRGTPELLDAVATVAGALPAVIVSLL